MFVCPECSERYDAFELAVAYRNAFCGSRNKTDTPRGLTRTPTDKKYRPNVAWTFSQIPISGINNISPTMCQNYNFIPDMAGMISVPGTHDEEDIAEEVDDQQDGDFHVKYPTTTTTTTTTSMEFDEEQEEDEESDDDETREKKERANLARLAQWYKDHPNAKRKLDMFKPSALTQMPEEPKPIVEKPAAEEKPTMEEKEEILEGFSDDMDNDLDLLPGNSEKPAEEPEELDLTVPAAYLPDSSLTPEELTARRKHEQK
jgi:hypothetical protein